jgi:hypothetical protein
MFSNCRKMQKGVYVWRFAPLSYCVKINEKFKINNIIQIEEHDVINHSLTYFHKVLQLSENAKECVN